MADPWLSFFADEVAAERTEYTPECVVYMIAFGTGDPETGGHCWDFSRSFDDDGVCTVREIQRAVLYEGIASFDLHRLGLECIFDSKGASEVGFSGLRITFEIDDKSWRKLAETAKIVFKDRSYFKCDVP